jgi:hypothetical protein
LRYVSPAGLTGVGSLVGKDRSVRYDLTGLGELEFEDLTQALALRVLGPGVQVFGDGPDGGREATFEGRLRYPDPDPDGPWDGYGVLQAKFKHQPLGANPDATWLRARITKRASRPFSA